MWEVGVVVYSSNLSYGEVEAGGLLHFKATLGDGENFKVAQVIN